MLAQQSIHQNWADPLKLLVLSLQTYLEEAGADDREWVDAHNLSTDKKQHVSLLSCLLHGISLSSRVRYT